MEPGTAGPTGRITLTVDPAVGYGGKYLLLVDGEEVLRFTPREPIELHVSAGRRKVQVMSKHRLSESNVLMLEVLESGTSPLVLSPSELGRAGSGGFASLWGKLYEIRRTDNDPGKPTR